jgi:hypothetical protein
MKCQQFYLPQSGKLVTQLPGGITFACDLCLGHLRDRWKGLAEEYIDKLEERYHSYRSSKAMPKKMSFRASKRPRKFGTRKLPKKLPI